MAVALAVAAAAAALAVLVAAAAAVAGAVVLGVEQRPVKAGRGACGLVGVEQREGLGAHAGAANLAEHVKQGEGGLRTRHGHVQVLGALERQGDVLAQVLHHEAGLVVAVQGFGGKRLGSAGAARAVGHELEHLALVDAGLLGQGKRVGVAHHAGGQAHLVAELGRLAAARLVEVDDLCREGLQDGQHGGRLLLGGAYDEREGAVLGALLATGDRAVEGVLVLDLGGVVDVAGELRGARGEVDEPGAALGHADESVGGQVDVLDVGGIAHHGEDDVGVLGGLGGGVRPLGAASQKALGLGLGAVGHRDVVAGVQDVARDGRAHDAGADEGDLAVGVDGHRGPFLMRHAAPAGVGAACSLLCF